MFVVAPLDGFHQQVARLCQATEEDEGFGSGECGKVGAGLTQHFAGELVDVFGQFVALAGRNADVEACDVLGL